MSRYVDGFVIPIPKSRIDDYRRVSEHSSKIWKEYGAIDYTECVGDDMIVEGIDTTFPMIAGAREDETVIFAWVVWPSKEARDSANAKIMADPRLDEMMDLAKSIFDPKRMAFGGFKELVHA